MKQSEAKDGFVKAFNELSYSQDYSTTFNSFLDFALWRLAPYQSHNMKEEIDRLNKYPDAMGAVMGRAFECWTCISDNEGEGFYDGLGDIFMDCVSFGRNGQFFTPQPICDMMAQLTYGKDLQPGKSVCDPACGSGRTLLSIGKLQRDLKFYGSDNDLTCVKMAALNLMINSMPGEIAWMDTLRMEHYRSYHISLYLAGTHYLPLLTITGKDETNFKQGLIREKEAVKIEAEELKQHKGQLILDF